MAGLIATATQIGAGWDRFIDGSDVDGTFPQFATLALGVVMGAQRLAAAQSVAYLGAFVATETASAIAIPPVDQSAHVGVSANGAPVAGRLDFARVTVKLRAAGGPDVASAAGRAMAVEIAGNVLMSTSRLTLHDAMVAEDKVNGWSRVTSPRCCAYCGLLSGRPPVTKLETVRIGGHSHCTCTAEPVVQGVRQVLARRRPIYPPPLPGQLNAAAATAAYQHTGYTSGAAFTAALATQRAGLLRTDGVRAT